MPCRLMIQRLLAVLAFVVTAVHGAEALPAKPPRFFNDYTGHVERGMADSLNERLAQYERESSNQLLVALYPRMQTNSSIEDYSTRTFESWGVGRADRDNGAVLFVFIEDRKMRIQTGYGLEATLTDAESFRIIEGMKPFFRAADYAGGASFAVTAMIEATKGEYQGGGKTLAEQNGPGLSPGIIFLILVVLFVCLKIFLAHRRNRERGYLYGPGGRRIYSPTWMDTMSWGTHGTGWSSGGSSSSGWSSGGSSWSGGGGSTGGGGASGSW